MSKKKIELDPNQYIVSKTDTKGNITYVNDYFMKISGYTQSEMLGQPHSIIRHPDMPKVIFKLLWKKIKSGKDIHAVIKNRAKDGRYYWVFTAFDIHYDADHNIDGYTAYRRGVNNTTIKKIGKLYSELLEIEKQEGVKASEKYLKKFLDKKDMNYDQYAWSLISDDRASSKFFAKMKKLFG
ncbi:SIGNAL-TRANSDUCTION SENSOR PROTEIN-PAS/PAC domain [hydrothermal vent metagenome]|uniref:SIGNAL-TRANSDUCTION SENSOR PROTEIN-PAS/PAC domain n=1 Tax=hydrothermal vent metagenome TaxID=652676 RepID=A0A1W1CAZ0_9ZZZZ